MDALDEAFWTAIGVQAWTWAATEEEALSHYLKVVPVIERSFIHRMFNQAPISNIASRAMVSGVARLHRSFGSFPRKSLLWSKQYTLKVKGQLVNLELRHGIYHRTGWNPLIAPLALRGLASLLDRRSVLLLGSDFVRWARTFSHPDTRLPIEWSAEELGAGAGILFVPSEDPEIPEEWVFYIEPGCYIVRNVADIYEELGPVMTSRIHFGKRIKVSFLVGFDAGITPGVTRAKHRFADCVKYSGHFFEEQVPMCRVTDCRMGLYTVVSLADAPGQWKYYQCQSLYALKWGSGFRPFDYRAFD